MFNKILSALGTATLALLAPSVSFGQCGKSGGGSSMRAPNFPSGFGNPNMPMSPSGFNTPTGLRRFGQPNMPMGLSQHPQLQMGMLMNQQFQQGMIQQVNFQYFLQDQLKSQLLRYAYEAPSENLRRGLKHSDAFVRWAASVELNRRWKADKALTRETERKTRAPRLSLATAIAREAATETPAPRRYQTDTPAIVTPVSQTLLLQTGIPK